MPSKHRSPSKKHLPNIVLAAAMPCSTFNCRVTLPGDPLLPSGLGCYGPSVVWACHHPMRRLRFACVLADPMEEADPMTEGSASRLVAEGPNAE